MCNSLSAQGFGTTTGTLAGDASNESGTPLQGVLISANGREGTKTATSDADGKYIFPYLTPGLYNVRAELQGFSSIEQNDVRIGLSQRLDISFQMKTTVQENVTVTSEAPLVDLTSTTVGANISDQLTQRIPVGRSMADIIYMAPGVVNARVGGANLSISGGSGLENTYIIDGANVTSPGFGGMGSISGFHGALGDSGLPVDMIKEAQVKTAGFEPEYGEALGGIINVITKSGENNFHGDGYVYFTPQSAGDKLSRGDYSADTGADIGGPIIKNKLFFFGAYNLTSFKTTILNQPNYPSYSALAYETNKSITNSYSMKVTANVASHQMLEFSSSGDPGYRPLSNQDGFGLDTYVDPRMKQSEWRFGTDSQVLRWSGILNLQMFIEAQAARAHDKFIETPFVESENLPRIVDHTTPEGFLDIGGFGGHRDFIGNNLQYSVKFTNLWKSHQFRYGLNLEDISFSQDVARSGPSFTAFNGQEANGYRVDIRKGPIYEVNAVVTPGLTPTTTKYLDWFAQDSWNITSHLDVTFGIRWEQQHIKGDGEGATDITFRNNWAPRIGATYDYLKNGNSKVFFHFGRFFEKVPNYIAVLFTPFIFADANYSDPALRQFIPGSGSLSGTYAMKVEGFGGSESPFRTRSQHSNEWTLGIEQEVRPGFSLGANFISRKVNHVMEGIVVDPEAPCLTLPDGGCIPSPLTVEDKANGRNSSYLITNVDGHIPGLPALVRDYRALVITAEKRLSARWQLLGSYRYAQLTGNYEGLFSTESGIGSQAPNNTTAGDFVVSPFLQFNYSSGPLPNDIRHMVKLFGSYELRNNLNTGVAFYFQTGRPITQLGDLTFFEGNRLDTPRGALGRTDSLTSVDVHADYSINSWRSQQITFAFDVFNLFNSQGVIAVDEIAEHYGRDLKPEANPNFLYPTEFQSPRSYRLLLRYSF